jgi:glycosyltransferase involved in cell wall biosynthesis
MVSVVIPAYNAGRFLCEAVESALAQTRPPGEILVVDDQSSDDTVAVARNLPVRLLQTPVNSGSAVARNLGIQAAKGSFIALLDADDLWLPHHLETVLPLVEEHPAVALGYGHPELFGEYAWNWPYDLPEHQPVYCFWQCVGRCIVPQMAVILRKDMFLSVGGYRAKFRQAQDFDLFLRLAYRHPFICTHRTTVRYRRHEGSVTINNFDKGLGFEYISRQKFLAEVNETAEFIERFCRLGLERWRTNILRAWEEADAESLRFHLSRAHLVPGADRYAAMWRRKIHLLPLKRLWMRAPPELRSSVRSVRMALSRS